MSRGLHIMNEVDEAKFELAKRWLLQKFNCFLVDKVAEVYGIINPDRVLELQDELLDEFLDVGVSIMRSNSCLRLEMEELGILNREITREDLE